MFTPIVLHFIQCQLDLKQSSIYAVGIRLFRANPKQWLDNFWSSSMKFNHLLHAFVVLFSWFS